MYPYTHDNWAWLNHRIGDQDGRLPPVVSRMLNSWVPDDDRRRLAAYTICAAVLDNVSRYYLRGKGGQPLDLAAALGYREYGDPQLLVTQARAALLGESQTMAVAMPPDPADGKEDEHADERAFAEVCQGWLDDWSDDEQIEKKLLEFEHDSLGVGDGVLALGWNTEAGRPKLRVYDPGWYFPDLDSMGDGDDFPRTVHIAWEECRDNDRTFLIRKTWRLAPLEVGRRLPWHAEGELSFWTCLYSDGEWDLSRVSTVNGLYDLSDDTATWRTEILDETQTVVGHEVDLGVDFIPVIHKPNGAAGKEHFGRPVWWMVVQLLEDLAASDSDLQVSSQLVGSAAMVEKGAGLPDELPMGPGARLRLPETGSAELLDNSNALTAMTGYTSRLRDLVSTNVRMPAEVLGRVKASELPSGFAAVVMFGPYEALIRELRLLGRDKYRLLPKMALRLAQAAGALPAGPLPSAELVFGSFLPSDRSQAIDMVIKLWGATPRPLISLETALEILQEEAGLDFEDAAAEARRINREAYAYALQLLDATGDSQGVRDLLNTGDLPTLDAVNEAQGAPTPPGQGGNALPTPDVTPSVTTTEEST